MYVILSIIFVVAIMFVCKLVGYSIDVAKDKVQKQIDVKNGKYRESKSESLSDKFK